MARFLHPHIEPDLVVVADDELVDDYVGSGWIHLAEEVEVPVPVTPEEESD